MRSKSDKTKDRLKMGQGDDKDYKPYIEVGEFGSSGTAICLTDYKTGRRVHLLSQAEANVWYLLRWSDDVIDIKEQYPLPLEETLAIAKEYGLNHPKNKNGYRRITSDFFVVTKYGNMVISAKASRDLNKLNVKNLFIEKQYWIRKGVRWNLIHTDSINKTKVANIRTVVSNYNATYFLDKINFLKYLISHKNITVDMEHDLDYPAIIKEREKEINEWLTMKLELGNNTE